MNNNDRFQTIATLREKLRHCDLADLARQHQVTIEKNDNINKGWVGQTLDKVAETNGLSTQAPDGIDYELKSVRVIHKNNEWVPKETIAITMFNPASILTETFENSALWHKLERLILIGHSYPGKLRNSATVRFIAPVDVADPTLKQEIKSFWENIQSIVKNGEIANYSSRDTSKGFVQLRTKGSGKTTSKCPITGQNFKTRAFYATKVFINYVRGSLG